MQEGGPVKAGELIGQALSLFRTGDFDKGIIELLEGHISAAHLDGEPVMAVDGNLDDEREPGLDADVDEAEVGMEEVIIEAETFSVRGDDAWAADGIGDFERGTSFQLGKDADEAAGDVEICGDTPGFVVLADVPREVLVRTFVMSCNGLGVQDETIGLSLDELGEVLDFEAASGYKLIQAFGIIDGFEMAFENDAVKAVESAGNLIGNFVGKRFHGVLS